jgi:hypothetical protein
MMIMVGRRPAGGSRGDLSVGFRCVDRSTPGLFVVGDIGVAGLADRVGDPGTVGVAGGLEFDAPRRADPDRPVLVMNGGMVLSAEERDGVDGGLSAVGPRRRVVDVTPRAGSVAAGEAAHNVAGGDGGAQLWADGAGGAADVDGFGVRS